MAVAGIVFRRDPLEVIGEVANYIRIRILLNQQRCGRMLTEQRQQPSLDTRPANPGFHFASEVGKALAAGPDLELIDCLPHLLDRDALGQIARLIHVASAANRNVISDQLQRHHFQNRQ